MKLRVFCFFAALILFVTVCNFDVYADGDDASEEELGELHSEEALRLQEEQKKDQYTLEQIASMSDEELAKLQLLRPTEDELTGSSKEVSGGHRLSETYSVYAPAVKQPNSYYCGPAATLMALYASGVASSVSGTTTTQKQATLAGSAYLKTDLYGGTDTPYVASTMNYFTNRFRTWTSAQITSSSQYSTVQFYTRSNLDHGHAVVFCIEIKDTSYYNPPSTGTHFITGVEITYSGSNYTDYANITLKVKDPHYNMLYFGTHTITFNDLMWAIHDFSVMNNFVY